MGTIFDFLRPWKMAASESSDTETGEYARIETGWPERVVEGAQPDRLEAPASNVPASEAAPNPTAASDPQEDATARASASAGEPPVSEPARHEPGAQLDGEPQSPQPSSASATSSSGAAPGFAPDPLKTLELKPLIIEQLSMVFDPEIPVNIYELGLVYDIDVSSAGVVRLRMTLTSPACPSAQAIPADAERRIRTVPGVTDVLVEVVWEPPWTTDKMTEAAKLQLGLW